MAGYYSLDAAVVKRIEYCQVAFPWYAKHAIGALGVEALYD